MVTAPVQVEASEDEASSPVREQAKALFRHSVLDAAEAEFAAHGFEATRMQDVAKRARVGVGTVYNHFAGKEELLRAVLAQRGQEALAQFSPQPDDGPTFEARFQARFGRMHGFFQDHIGFFVVASRHGFMGNDPTHESDPLDEGMRRQVAQLLLEGMAEGVLEQDDPERLGRFLKGASKGVLMGAALAGAVDLREEGRWVVTRFLRGAMKRLDAPREDGR